MDANVDHKNIYALGWRFRAAKSRLASLFSADDSDVCAYFQSRPNYSVDRVRRKFHYANPATGVTFTILGHRRELIVWFPLLRSEPFIDEILIEIQEAIPHFDLEHQDCKETRVLRKVTGKMKPMLEKHDEFKHIPDLLEQLASRSEQEPSDGLARTKEEWIYKNRFRIHRLLCEDPHAIDGCSILPNAEIKRIWEQKYYGRDADTVPMTKAVSVSLNCVLAAEDVEFARQHAARRVGKTILAPLRDDEWE